MNKNKELSEANITTAETVMSTFSLEETALKHSHLKQQLIFLVQVWEANYVQKTDNANYIHVTSAKAKIKHNLFCQFDVISQFPHLHCVAMFDFPTQSNMAKSLKDLLKVYSSLLKVFTNT